MQDASVILPNMSTPIEPGAVLGILGGGQLGRMFVQAAQSLGYTTAVLDEQPDSPAGTISQYHIRSRFTDNEGLMQLAELCEAVTTEFENVPASSLDKLSHKLPVAPQASAVALCQNRIREKALLKQCGITCAPHVVLQNKDDLSLLDERLFPALLKTATMGYDGKGQFNVENTQEVAQVWDKIKYVPCIVEKRMNLLFEVSVIVARNSSGQTIHYPIQKNLHRNGILAVTEVAWDKQWLPDELQQQAYKAAKKIANALNYVGVMCVEFFVLDNNTLVANEIAPRPHNSGHWTIDGCYCSQFEAQVRTLAGLSLADPGQHASAVMLNLLGDLWFDAQGTKHTPPWDRVLALPGAHLHLYGKSEVRPGRKMGHLTVAATRLVSARETAQQAAELLGIAPW